jgi:hypothetical protein
MNDPNELVQKKRSLHSKLSKVAEDISNSLQTLEITRAQLSGALETRDNLQRKKFDQMNTLSEARAHV